MHWVIEQGPFEENLDNFINVVENVSVVKYRPFDIETPYEFQFGQPVPNSDRKDVIFYGSINLGRRLLRKQYCWQNWLPDKVFDCSYWMPRFGTECYNDDYVLVPFGSLERFLTEQVEYNWLQYSIFVRPNSGYKLFTGHTIATNKHLDKTLSNLRGQYQMFPEDLILVAPAGCTYMDEYRFLIGQADDYPTIIASSQYRKNGESATSNIVPPECVEYVKSILQKCDEMDYCPAPAWTLDICYVNESYYIMEVGSFTSAGLYNCNVTDVVSGIESVVKYQLGI